MKAIKRIFFITIVVSLLGLNVATLVSATAYNALHGLLSHLPIPSLFNNSIATKHQMLKQKNTKLIKKNKTLTSQARLEQSDMKKIKQENEKLTTKTKILKQKNNKLAAELKIHKNINKGFVINKLRSNKKITDIVNRSQIRIVKSAVANIAIMPAEAIPIVGISAILTATALEIYWSCQNMKDLDAINSIINSDNFVAQSDKVCGLKVPTIKEIKNKIGL